MNRRPKGTGSIRMRDGHWEAAFSYIDPSGKRRRRTRRGFTTKTEARRWLNVCISEGNAAVSADGLTVGSYLEQWLGSLGMQQLEANTLCWYSSAVRRHITPAIGGVRLDQLTATQIEAFLAAKASDGRLDGTGGLGAASVRRLAVTLHTSLDGAVRKGLLARNPSDLAARPKIPRVDVTATVWSPAQLGTFLQVAAGDRLEGLWRVAAMTGLRRSELVGLRWGDIDLERSELSVRTAVVQVDGRPVVKGPKTARSRRVVELDLRTVAILRQWRVNQLEERLRAGAAWQPGEWVFTDELGCTLRPDGVTYRLQKLCRTAGLPVTTIRGLRHAHATAMLAAGVHPRIAQERLGHASITTTLQTYSAVLPGMQREAAQRLSALIGGE